MARKLYGGNLSKEMIRSISKYRTGRIKKPFLVTIAFYVVNLLDRSNNYYQPKNRGVGILVKTVK